MKTINEIFSERTCYKFQSTPIEKGLLIKIYDLMKFGPTSGNSCPLRIIFVQSQQEKEKLMTCVAEMNKAKIASAPVTALFAYDLKFFTKMDKLYPTGKALQQVFASSEAIAVDTAYRNSSLQAAYFMVIARSMGLDCGGMSGFDQALVNEAFFKNTDLRINFICNLGYRDGENPYPRLPRLDFDESCKIV